MLIKQDIFKKSDFLRVDPRHLNYIEFKDINFYVLAEQFSTNTLTYSDLVRDYRAIEDDYNTLHPRIENYFSAQMNNATDLYTIKLRDSVKPELDEQKIRAWYYAWSCCKFLEAHWLLYHNDPQHKDVIAYQKKAEEIENTIKRELMVFCSTYGQLHPDNPDQPHKIKNIEEESQALLVVNPQPANAVVRTLKDLRDDIRKALKTVVDDIKDAPLSQARNWLSFFNMYRIFWVFVRVTTTQLLLFLRQKHIFDTFELWFNKSIAEKRWIAWMEKGNIATNFLSVGYYAVRFIMNLSMIIKHIWFVNESIKDDVKTSKIKRLMAELHKRHVVLLNDLCWGTINGLTNYAWFFQFSAGLVQYLTVGFLMLDFLLVLDGYWLVTRKRYKDSLARLQSYEDLDPRAKALNDQQIADYKIQWNAALAKTIYQSVAAAIFVSAFATSFFFATPLMGAILFGLCVLAVTMYLTDGKAELLFHSTLTHRAIKPVTEQLIAEKEKARTAIYKNSKDLFLSILEKALLPTITITLLVVCWQAALVFAALYLGYKLYMWNRSKHPEVSPANNASPVATDAAKNTAEADSQSPPLLNGAVQGNNKVVGFFDRRPSSPQQQPSQRKDSAVYNTTPDAASVDGGRDSISSTVRPSTTETPQHLRLRNMFLAVSNTSPTKHMDSINEIQPSPSFLEASISSA